MFSIVGRFARKERKQKYLSDCTRLLWVAKLFSKSDCSFVIAGVSVGVKEANNVLSRGKRGTDFLTLHEECVVEGCTVEEILEHEDINEECVVEGCNSEEISEYPEVS